MNRRVNEILKENLELEPPRLLSSLKEIRLSVQKGRQYQDFFRIGTTEDIKIRGYVYSDDHRIVFASEKFKGTSCKIVYGLDTCGLKENDVINGNIYVVSDIGELCIPVNVTIEDRMPEPFEEIQTLDNFAKMAMHDFRKAFLLYTNEKFISLLKGKNNKYIPLYRGLSENPVTYQHLEEFLIASGKKERISISADKKEKLSYVLGSTIKDTMYIYKSTWGYAHIEVSVKGDFIEVNKRSITSDDFIGRVYGLEFILNRDRLCGRKCRGRIILKTVYETLEFEITASPYEDMELVSSKYRKIRILNLLREYLDLQLKRVDYRTWYEKSSEWLKEIKEESEDFFTLYAEAYLAACQEEKAKLVELLWPIKTGEIVPKKPWEKAVYLYLSKEAGLLPKEDSNIAPMLYAYYKQSPEDFIILELYLRELEAHGYNSPWGLSELEKVYNLGCRSPFLYLRAWKLLSAQESLLRRLSPFMIRVLLFAHKEGLITESLLLRTAFLSENLKKFYPTLYSLLSNAYDEYKRREILEAICRYIMNDDPTDPVYYKWYEKAVEQDIRLTRLYEYYIETRPESETTPLPAAVKLYFSYNSGIGERKKAYLYANIIKDKENDPISYENYEKNAREFASASLKKGRINEYYAVLYREFYPECKTAETAGYIADILFRHRLVLNDPKVRNVIVCHPALRDMRSYPVRDNTAYPDIYSKDACILFEDDKKRRFAATVEYELEPLMDIPALAKSCMYFGMWDTGIQLYVCHEKTWQVDINSKNLMSFWKAAENLYFTREYRDRTRHKLLSYFNKHTEEWNLIRYAESMKELTYAQIEKPAAFDFLVRFGQYDKAFNVVNNLGYEDINIAMLLKLAIEKIKSKPYEADEEILDMAYHIYKKGIFTEEILDYIGRFGGYNAKEAEAVRGDMLSFGMDTYNIEEKYLLISMFTMKTSKNSEEILEAYSKKSGKPYIRAAYMIFLSMLFILKDRKISDTTADRIKDFCKEYENKSIFCILAWIKYKAVRKNITSEETPFIKKLLDDCDRKEIRLGFFKELPDDITAGYNLDDKVFAEASLRSGEKTSIHFRLTNDSEKEVKWRSEPIKECVKGLYSREFLLFFGEGLEYYFTFETGDGPVKTDIKKIEVDEVKTEGRTKYQLINRILKAKKLGAYDKMHAAAKQYLESECFAKKLFEIL